MAAVQKITPFLWFDTEAEEAAKYYVSIFKNSKLGKIGRYGEAGKETHRRPVGSVMVVEFTLEGQRFMALNGGPNFKFNEAISLHISCETRRRSTTTGTSCPRAAPRRAAVRLAQGQVRAVLAGGPRADGRAGGRPERPGVAAGHGRDDGDEEDRRGQTGGGEGGSGGGRAR